MDEADPNRTGNEAAPKFRFNGAVVKMLGICALALGLPIAVAIVGITGIRKASQPATAAAEIQTDGLRNSLESIAEEKLPAPKIDGGTRRFVFEKSESYDQTLGAIRVLLANPEVTAINTDNTNTRWIVKVPSAIAQGFDSKLSELKPVKIPKYPIDGNKDNIVFYEINMIGTP